MYFPREKGGGGTEPAGNVVQDPDVGQTQYKVDLQGYKLTVGNSVKPGRYIQTISQQTGKNKNFMISHCVNKFAEKNG